MPPFPDITSSETFGSVCTAGVCATLPYSSSSRGLTPPPLTLSGLLCLFGMGQRGWELPAPEGKGTPTDIVDCSTWGTSKYTPVEGWVVSPMRGYTTSLGWFRTPGNMGAYPVAYLDRRQSTPGKPLTRGESPQ